MTIIPMYAVVTRLGRELFIAFTMEDAYEFRSSFLGLGYQLPSVEPVFLTRAPFGRNELVSPNRATS